jgi:hypothetical protein
MKMINPLDHLICLAQPLRLDRFSAWIEHIPFAMFLVDIARPRVLVELGTHMGVSYSAFCQAVKHLRLQTRCYAVDTWQGDEQAGFYGPEVLADLRAHHDLLYGKFSSLVQSTFDDAVQHFDDNSIDLLHIDGLHTYEAVKHDFETWLPKLSQRSVVLLHDVNEPGHDFGVWKLWTELQDKYPHFEFYHGHGLGILQIGSEPITELEPLFSMSNDQPECIREFFFTLGSHLSMKTENEHQLHEKEKCIQSMQSQIVEKESQIAEKESQIAEKESQISGLNQTVSAWSQVAMEREKQIIALSTTLTEIYSSRSWHFVQFLRRIRSRITGRE